MLRNAFQPLVTLLGPYTVRMSRGDVNALEVDARSGRAQEPGGAGANYGLQPPCSMQVQIQCSQAIADAVVVRRRRRRDCVSRGVRSVVHRKALRTTIRRREAPPACSRLGEGEHIARDVYSCGKMLACRVQQRSGHAMPTEVRLGPYV